VNRGFVVVAQNTKDLNYVRCAEALASSIKQVMPDEKISLITCNKTTSDLFDQVIPLPYGDLARGSAWKLINDWQVYEASPYDYTIKLEADLYIPRSIEYWWDILKDRDVVISTTIRNFKQEISDIKAYRRFIYDNNLPDTYNAITYFKKSEVAEHFFKVVREVFENWEEFTKVLKCNQDEPATTDWVYAIASHIVGVEKTTLPNFTDMSMIHMKQFISGAPSDDWTRVFVHEILDHSFRVNTIPQKYPFHYQVKNFAEQILEKAK